MKPQRLSARALAEHLRLEAAAVARLVRALRRTVLRTVPDAAEAIKFGVLCYYDADACFGALGGNVCMIEVKDGPRRREGAKRPGNKGRAVFLSFIHGSSLPDPHALLQGRLKAKRFLPIPDAAAATGPGTIALLRASRDLRPWD